MVIFTKTLDAFVVKSDILFRALEKHFGFASKSKFNLEDNPTVVINQKELMN